MITLVEQELERYTVEDLMSCLASSNSASIYDIIHNPKSKYKGPNGPVLAAVKL